MKQKPFIRTLASVRTRSRGYLPHWELEGSTYSITFRLHGSLPRDAVERLREQRRKLELAVTGGARELTAFETMDVRAEMEKRLDDELHASDDVAWLRNPALADLTASVLTYFDGERYRLFSWRVMPNHVHILVKPNEGWSLATILHSWKSFSSNRANRILGHDGPFWAREYFDRIIRDDEDLLGCAAYILGNPAKAALTGWRWTSAGWRSGE